MKKILSITLVFVILFQLTSCFKQKPSKTFSQEFQDHFLENYAVVDPCISYFEANKIDALIKVQPSRENDFVNVLQLAKIKDIDDLSFVAVIPCKYTLPMFMYFKAVYQTKDAPVPMRDWQIKKIFLSDSSPYTDFRPEKFKYQEPHQEQLSEECLCAVFEAGKDDLLIQAIVDAYRDASPLTKMPRGVCVIGSDFNYSFHFVVQFEECPNICWNTQICYQNGKYYISIMNERDENDPSKWVEKYGELDERVYPMIVPFFEEKGWEGKDWGEK